MAIPTIKTTYSLDPETIRALEEMARRLGVSKSEALRRAIRAAASERGVPEGRAALEALDALQRSLGLPPSRARTWGDRMRRERRASSSRGKSDRR
jgi:hypothetical protein